MTNQSLSPLVINLDDWFVPKSYKIRELGKGKNKFFENNIEMKPPRVVNPIRRKFYLDINDL